MTSTLEQLTDEFAAWTTAQGLPAESADELLVPRADLALTPDQRSYLWRFCERWEEAQRADDGSLP